MGVWLGACEVRQRWRPWNHRVLLRRPREMLWPASDRDQSKCEALASLFGLSFKAIFTGVETRYSLRKVEILECFFLAMPTGWSWALVFCHDAISTAMKTALHQFSFPGW